MHLVCVIKTIFNNYITYQDIKFPPQKIANFIISFTLVVRLLAARYSFTRPDFKLESVYYLIDGLIKLVGVGGAGNIG